MKAIEGFFLIGAVVELIAGVALLTAYNNPLGYMGLIASVMFVLALPIVGKIK